VFIENDRGYKHTFPIIRKWTRLEVDFRLDITFTRTFQLSVTEDDESAGVFSASTQPSVQIVLPQKALVGQVKVGLVLDDGSETENIDAYIETATGPIASTTNPGTTSGCTSSPMLI